MSSKTNVLKFFSDEIETISWESEAKPSRLLQSKFGHGGILLENGFEATLSSKTNIPWVRKEDF